MVFASLTFLYVFLPLNLLGYFALRRDEHRNLLLIVFSLAFYAWGEPIWIALLLCSSAVDYVHGRIIEAKRGTPWAKGAVVSSLVINLGLLAVFKYSGFACAAINDLFGTSLSAPAQLSLPIGISFYTFQTISYVIDVYRDKLPAQRSFFKFLLFVSLFHQLVAGPIVRYADIAHEIDHRQHSLADASAGVSRFCAGLFKKVCIANVAGQLVLQTMAKDSAELSVAEGWFGLLMFSLQIYFDFAGYSDMAIGLGRICGFHYHENFNHPYIARSAGEFWRRWHISLGSFFRDYLYIPLGGNRRRPYVNLFVVWALTGLWHGASWNFMFWGLYFGVLIAAERLFLNRVLEALPRAASHVYLLFAVVVGWALFYFEDLDRLGEFLGLLFGASGRPGSSPELAPLIQTNALWLVLAVLLCMPIVPRLRERVDQLASGYRIGPTLVGSSLALINLGMLLVATAMLVGGTYNPFLYFRF
jgi:alginate O-acetyltransferase complex protein AlgI